MKTNRPSFTAEAAESAQKEKEALRLRIQGKGFAQIGEALGCSTAWAHTLVTRALKAIPAENARELRQLMADRIDAIVNAHWSAAIGEHGEPPDVKSATLVLEAETKRAKLYGIEAATKVKVEGDLSSLTDADLAKRAEELAARLREAAAVAAQGKKE